MKQKQGENEERDERAKANLRSQYALPVATPAERGARRKPSGTQRRREGGHTEKDVPHARRPEASWESYVVWFCFTPTSPGLPRRAPIQELTRPSPAQRPRSHGIGAVRGGTAVEERLDGTR